MTTKKTKRKPRPPARTLASAARIVVRDGTPGPRFLTQLVVKQKGVPS